MGYFQPEDEEEQSANPVDNEIAAPDAEVPEVPAVAPADVDPEAAKNEAIRAHLAAEYASAKDDSGIKAAQERAAHMNTVANIGDALESIFKSNSVAHGGAGVDTGFYQGIKAQGAQGVQQAQAVRNAKVQDLVQQHEINRQIAQEMMTKGTYDQQQKAAQFANDQQDPNSRTSKNAQASFKSIFKDQPGIADMDVSQFSASDLARASKDADVVAKLNEMKATKEMQLDYQKENLKDKRDTKQDQLYTELSNKLTNPRGNTAVQQAAVGVASGKKAMDLIDQYPDLNKMPSQQVALLAQEISKVASGGVGSEHGQRSIEANTMQSNWNKFVSNLSGEPTGAELKGFIEQNKTYLQNMMKTNMDTIKDYHTQVYNGYKKRLTPEQDAMFRADNPEVFQEETGQQKVLPAYEHPQSGQAAKWAQDPANANDPRAQEILKRLGTMNAGI